MDTLIADLDTWLGTSTWQEAQFELDLAEVSDQKATLGMTSRKSHGDKWKKT